MDTKGPEICLKDFEGGKVALTVIDANETEIHCCVEIGGPLSNHKSINIPNFHIDMPYISEQDKAVITAGVPLGIEGTTNLLKVQIVQ